MAKNVATYCGAKGLFTTVAKYSVWATAGIAGTVFAYDILYDFPRAKTASALNDVSQYCHEKQYEKAQKILEDAKNWTLNDQFVIEYYDACFDVLRGAATIEDSEVGKYWVAKANPLVDDTLNLLAKSDYYTRVRNDLLYHQIIANVNAGELEKAKTILHSIDKNSPVHVQMVYFIIGKAQHIAQTGRAETYLEKAQSIFQIPEYKQIIERYQQYVSCQKEHPELTETSAQETIQKMVAAIDAVIIAANKLNLDLTAHMQSKKFALYINTKKYADAKELIDLKIISVADQACAVLQVINRAENVSRSNQNLETIDYLTQAYDGLTSLVHRTVIDSYRDIVKCRPQRFTITDVGDQWTTLTDSLTTEIKPIDELKPLRLHLLHQQFEFYVHKHSYQRAKNAFSQPEISEESRAAMITHLVASLIQFPLRLEEVQHCAELFGISEHTLVRNYKNSLIDLQQYEQDPNSVQKIMKTIQSLDIMSSSLETAGYPPFNWILRIEVDLYIEAGRLYMENQQFRPSRDAYSAAEELLRRQNRAENQEELAHVHWARERAERILDEG
jgi:hypothetical protein